MSKNQSLSLRARFEEFILFQKTQGTFQSRNGKIHDRLGFMISRQREELFPKIGIVGSFYIPQSNLWSKFQNNLTAVRILNDFLVMYFCSNDFSDIYLAII